MENMVYTVYTVRDILLVDRAIGLIEALTVSCR